MISGIINMFNAYPIFKLFEAISGRADESSESKVRLNIIYGMKIAIIKEIVHLIYVFLLQMIGFGQILYLLPIIINTLKIGWYCSYLTTLKAYYIAQIYSEKSRVYNQNKLWDVKEAKPRREIEMLSSSTDSSSSSK